MFKQISHLRHLIRAGLVFARHDVIPPEQLLQAPTPARLLFKLAKMVAGKPTKTSSSGLNAALEELGPSYIKLGQFLATRPDFVGKDRATELSALQDKLAPFPQDVAEAEVEKQLKTPLKQVFSKFSSAIAAASIAQVHKAEIKLPNKGQSSEVAVKILRPNVKRRFKKDLDSFFFAARMMERWIEPLRSLRPVEAVNVLARSVDMEMDLRLEAAAMSEMAENTEKDAGFRIPKINWQYTTGRVLVSEWIDGIPLNEPGKLKAAGFDLKKLAEKVMQSFLLHAIRDGFFHADMHQGNLFIEKDGTIVAIDFGIMGRIDRRARQWLAEILYGLTTGNYKRVAEIHFEAQYVPSYHSVGEFATALRAVGEPMRGKPVKELSVGQMLDGLFAITRDFDMQTQPHLLLLQKTMVMVEGIATQLNPEINMWDTSAPYVREWIRDELGPESAVADRLKEDAKVLFRLPDLIRRIEDRFPAKGGAPEAAPLPEIPLLTDKRARGSGGGWFGYFVAGAVGAGAVWGASLAGLI